MANEILSSSSTQSYDREKFLAASLLSRSTIKLVCASVCEKVAQKKGTGLTAYFVRYARGYVPMTTLTEGTTPSNSTFSLEEVSVTLDQWGDVITLTDVVQLTQAHPILEQAMELLADNAARVIDRETQIVWFAGTNIQYGDASVTTRATVTTAMTISNAILHKARVTMVNNGAPPRDGPATKDAKAGSANGDFTAGRSYLAICGPEVISDLQATSTSFGSWVSVHSYANQKALYNHEVGTWLGFRFVETNFIPRISMLGSTTAAVASGNAFGTGTPTVTAVDGGGTLTSSTTYYYKVVRKDLTRGFAEQISVAHSTASTATANNESFTFAFPSTAGYVFDLYFGTAATDADLKLVSANIAAGTTTTVTAPSASTTTAPANVNTTGTPTIHPVYIFSKDACKWVGLQNLKVMMSKPGASTEDPLDQRRTIAYKFMGKAVLLDQTRLLRLELASTY